MSRRISHVKMYIDPFSPFSDKSEACVKGVGVLVESEKNYPNRSTFTKGVGAKQ